jgi:ABC-type polysaccharide/polyol phosphate export permease
MIETFKEAGEIYKYRELLRNLVLRDIKVRYKRSLLGFLWVMLNPLLMMLILNIVFSELFKVSIPNYSAYLLSGLILWGFFSQSTSTAINSFIGNSNLIKKVYLPKSIFPLAIILSATIHFVFSLLPLSVILYINDISLGPRVFLLPIVFLTLIIFSFGVSLIISTATVFFQDVRYIYEVLLLAWMYMTPVFYPESIVPEKYMFIMQLNPFYYYISLFRSCLYMDITSLYEKLLISFLFALFSFLVGWLLYSRYRQKIVYYL